MYVVVMRIKAHPVCMGHIQCTWCTPFQKYVHLYGNGALPKKASIMCTVKYYMHGMRQHIIESTLHLSRYMCKLT